MNQDDLRKLIDDVCDVVVLSVKFKDLPDSSVPKDNEKRIAQVRIGNLDLKLKELHAEGMMVHGLDNEWAYHDGIFQIISPPHLVKRVKERLPMSCTIISEKRTFLPVVMGIPVDEDSYEGCNEE